MRPQAADKPLLQRFRRCDRESPPCGALTDMEGTFFWSRAASTGVDEIISAHAHLPCARRRPSSRCFAPSEHGSRATHGLLVDPLVQTRPSDRLARAN